MTTVILDNGHGQNTPGKCSPDKSIYEWLYCRLLVNRIAQKLIEKEISVRILVTEDTDISLQERVKRANAIKEDSVLISVHLNAAGNGSKWMSASGWTVWVSKNASDKSKRLAKVMYEEAKEKGLKGNRCVPKEEYWESNFYILKNTKMPAILTENMFQDNKDDVSFLLSENGMETLADVHVNAIIKYIS